MQIEIDFDVFKALTARRQHESHSYNDVLRELLNLGRSTEDVGDGSFPRDDLPVQPEPSGHTGFYSTGLLLPSGTLLRARYKHQEYHAKIVGDKWLDANDRQHSSASAAAAAITGTNVNGLRFWEAKRPGDTDWRRLELLRKQ